MYVYIKMQLYHPVYKHKICISLHPCMGTEYFATLMSVPKLLRANSELFKHLMTSRGQQTRNFIAIL